MVTLSEEQENVIVDALARRWPGGSLVTISILEAFQHARDAREK
jgi:hypothetical protein